MALFPFPDTEGYQEGDRSILNKMENFYRDSITINQSFWAEADIDTRFETGDQTIWEEVYGRLAVPNKRQFSFNRIKRIVNMISGHQRRNRKSIIVTPVENGDQKTADQFTKVLSWIAQQEGMLESVSDAFHGSLVTGMNLLQVWIDYRNDPVSGNIKIDNCPYNTFLIDPFFKKADLSDCNAIWKRSFLTKRECISLMPDKTDILGSMQASAGGVSKDNKFQYMAESYNYGPRDLFAYDEFYYKAYRTQKVLVDTETGETLEWPTDDEDKLQQFLKQYPQVNVISQEIPTVNLAIVVQGRVLYDDRNPLGTDQYPFVPFFSYYNPTIPYLSQRIQGVVRGLRDAQYLYNRRRVIELDILESQINSGFIYKENALVNPKDIFLTGQGRGLALKEEAQMTDVQRIPPADIASGAMQLTELLAREVMEISGVNEELLGSAVDDKAGILSMLRQGAGLTTLEILFDQLDRSTKNLGKLLINVIQNNFTPGKIKRIIEEEPTKEFYNKAWGRYDAAVEEGLNTSTQRQLQFAQMLSLREAGVPITPEDLLQASTVQNKQDIIDNMQKAQQEQAQQQQAMAQSQMQLQAANAELAKARAFSDYGQGIERRSRVEENRALAVERIAAANKDDEMADLNKIKAMKELEEMDIMQLERLIAIAQVLKDDTKTNKEDLEQAANSQVDHELENSPEMMQMQQQQNMSTPTEQGPTGMPGLE